MQFTIMYSQITVRNIGISRQTYTFQDHAILRSGQGNPLSTELKIAHLHSSMEMGSVHNQ